MEPVTSFNEVVGLLRPSTLAALIADFDRYEGCLEPGQVRFLELCERALIAVVGAQEAARMVDNDLDKA